MDYLPGLTSSFYPKHWFSGARIPPSPLLLFVKTVPTREGQKLDFGCQRLYFTHAIRSIYLIQAKT
jgi:hypothetical protein